MEWIGTALEVTFKQFGILSFLILVLAGSSTVVAIQLLRLPARAASESAKVIGSLSALPLLLQQAHEDHRDFSQAVRDLTHQSQILSNELSALAKGIHSSQLETLKELISLTTSLAQRKVDG